MEQNVFISSMIIDEEKRIVVTVQEQYRHFLKEDMIKSMLKETATKALGERFKQLEVSPCTFRVTVESGTENESLSIIETEIAKNIEMALNFLNAMNP